MRGVWLGSLVAERRTGDEEVAGSSLTHRAAEHGRGQATHTRVPLSPSGAIRHILWCKGGDAPNRCSETIFQQGGGQGQKSSLIM